MLHFRHRIFRRYLPFLILLFSIVGVYDNFAFAQSDNAVFKTDVEPSILQDPSHKVLISEKDVVIKAWINDIILLAKDPQAAIAKLELDEKKLDDQTRDRIWVFSNPTGFRSEVGRFSGKPIVSEDVRALRRLYLSATDGNPDAIPALESYSNSNDIMLGFYAKSILAHFYGVQNEQGKLIDTVNQMITLESRIPEKGKDEYDVILLARLQEKAVYSKDVILIIESTRNLMTESYRYGLGQSSASNLYNLFQTLFVNGRLDDAESIVEAMGALAKGANVEDRFSLSFAEAVIAAEKISPQKSAKLFDEVIPLAQATGNARWVDVTYAYAAREYAFAGDFKTARAREAMATVIPRDQMLYADVINFEEAFAKKDIKAAETYARKLIAIEKEETVQSITPASWSRYKTYENEAMRNEALLTELSNVNASEQDIRAKLSNWKWFSTLLLALLTGVGLSVFTLLKRAGSDLMRVKSSESRTIVMEEQLQTENQKYTALSKLLESIAEEISTRLTPSLTLIEFATRSNTGEELPFASEAMAALRSFSVLSLDMAAIAGGKLPKPKFETIESQNIDALLRKRLRDHMDGDASCEIRFSLSEDVPVMMTMDCDRVLHIIMCLVAGAWKRSYPAPVQIECGFDREKGLLKVDVIDVGGIVPANIEDQFSQLPSDSTIGTQDMLLRMQYAAADRLVEAMGGTIEFNGSHSSPGGHGLKATVNMPVIRQTSEEGAPSYIITAPGLG